MNSERSDPNRKPRYQRLKKLLRVRQQQMASNWKWYSRADADGNISVVPIHR